MTFQLALWSKETHWHVLADRFAAMPAPPKSETRIRIRLRMERGEGERHDLCKHYDDCLGEAARASTGDWHCPPACASRTDVTREELLAEAIAGRCRSPLADLQEEVSLDAAHVVGRPPMSEAILAAMAGGADTTVTIARACGYPRDSVSSRMPILEKEGKVRRAGTKPVPGGTGRLVLWEVVK